MKEKLNRLLMILNANIRDMRTNLDDFKVLLNYTFPIIGVTDTWLKPHNVENRKNYSHDFDIRHKKTGVGVSLFLTSNMIYSLKLIVLQLI